MINDHIIIQKHLIYFKKTFHIVRNLKNKSELFPPFPSKTLTIVISIRSLFYEQKRNIISQNTSWMVG